MAYHFYHLESRVVLHGHDAGNGEVWSAIGKLCCKGSARIIAYLNWDPLSSRKEHSHVLHWSLSFDEGRDLPQKLSYLIPIGDVGWLWMEGRRSHVFKRLFAEVI